MPDRSQPNVFAAEFLQGIRKQDPTPITALEATWAGPWRVRPRGGVFVVIRDSGGEPEAVTEIRESALLLAAVLPIVGRTPLYHLERQETEAYEIALKATYSGRGFTTVGRLRSIQEGLAEPLNVADYLLRSPAALAFLLEAASAEALEQAGAVLAGRILDQRE